MPRLLPRLMTTRAHDSKSLNCIPSSIMATKEHLGFGAVLAVAAVVALAQPTSGAALNSRPVIGVLAQASPDEWKQYGDEYVMAEYIKYLEMAGAAVVVLKGNQAVGYYTDLFHQLNGLLLPGGDVDILKSPYARTSRIFYQMAMEANDKGDYFPIWGTCQGFEMLTALTTHKKLIEPSDAENLLLPLDLLPAYKDSRLLGKAPRNIIAYLTNERLTGNFHHFCITTKTFNNEAALNKFYRLISTNKDRNGKEFVSTIEAFNYPFYGVQWHPEKNPFTLRTDKNLSHSPHAIDIAQYFADFFVNEARRSSHKFVTEKARSLAVVENDVRIFLSDNYIENFFYNVTKI